MSLKFDLSAVDGLQERFAEAAGELERQMGGSQAKSAIKAALEPVNEAAKARIHSISGHLAGGIQNRITVRVDAPTEVEDGISYKRAHNAHHAHLVEGGHGGPHPAPPHPFWEPAVQACGQEAVDAVEAILADLMEGAFI